MYVIVLPSSYFVIIQTLKSIFCLLEVWVIFFSFLEWKSNIWIKRCTMFTTTMSSSSRSSRGFLNTNTQWRWEQSALNWCESTITTPGIITFRREVLRLAKKLKNVYDDLYSIQSMKCFIVVHPAHSSPSPTNCIWNRMHELLTTTQSIDRSITHIANW